MTEDVRTATVSGVSAHPLVRVSRYRNRGGTVTPASVFPSSYAGARFAWRLFSSAEPWRPGSSCGTDGHGEHVSLLPVVMSEREFIEVEREIILRDLMEGPHHAALEETPEAVNVRGVDVPPHVLVSGMADGLVRHRAIKILVSLVLIRDNERDLIRDGVPDEAGESLGVRLVDHPRDDAPLARDGTDDGNLAHGAAPALAAPLAAPYTSAVPILGLPADVGLVNFNDAGKLLEIVVLHRGPDSVAHVPSGSVGAAPDGPVDLKRAHALLALAHEVDHLEPRAEWVIRVLKDRANERREVVAVRRALATAPRPRAAEPVNLLVSTAGAANSLGPSHFHEIGAAGILGLESVGEFRQGHHAEQYRPLNAPCQVRHKRLSLGGVCEHGRCCCACCQGREADAPSAQPSTQLRFVKI